MAANVATVGYFSVLKWRSDATRDEARNLAVILVDEAGRFGGIKAAPLSTISSRLREQGILDSMLVGLEGQFASHSKPKLATLREMHTSLQRSVYVTEPQEVTVPDVDAVLEALYRAYAAPRPGGTRAVTKAVVLDRVVSTLRRGGLSVRRGEYVGDFLFDAVIDSPAHVPQLVEVLSFAAPRKDWVTAEYDAAHFLYALEQVHRQGMAVIQPPSDSSRQNAAETHARVLRWLQHAQVPTYDPQRLAELQPTAPRGQGTLPFGRA